MLNVTIPKFTASVTDEKTHPSFHDLRFQKGCLTTFTAYNMQQRIHLMRWISRRLTQRLHRTDGGAQTVCLLWLVPSYPWGKLFESPQDEPQSVKVVGLYLSDRRFCPDIDFRNVFTLEIIKDTLAEKGLYIDCELRKGNIRA